MTLAQWLPFAVASAILVAIPGPTVLLVVSYALGHGRKYALATTAGVALGDLTSMTASMLGLGVLLAASAELFMGFELGGAGLLCLSGHQVVARAGDRCRRGQRARRVTYRADRRSRLRGHHAQSEEHHFLHRVLAAIHRSACREHLADCD